MKVEVTLYQGGQTFKDTVVVSKFEDAKKTLTNKAVCKSLKDPSAVFLLGLKSACNVHQ